MSILKNGAFAPFSFTNCYNALPHLKWLRCLSLNCFHTRFLFLSLSLSTAPPFPRNRRGSKLRRCGKRVRAKIYRPYNTLLRFLLPKAEYRPLWVFYSSRTRRKLFSERLRGFWRFQDLYSCWKPNSLCLSCLRYPASFRAGLLLSDQSYRKRPYLSF